MGQQLPLPERIPLPKEDQLSKLESMGITIAESKDEYVEYTLPIGWKMVDRSHREDLPYYHIVDSDSMIRVTISGAWKGTYDNELKMYIPKLLEICTEPESDRKTISETDLIHILVKIAEELDPLKRLPDVVDKAGLDRYYIPK